MIFFIFRTATALKLWLQDLSASVAVSSCSGNISLKGQDHSGLRDCESRPDEEEKLAQADADVAAIFASTALCCGTSCQLQTKRTELLTSIDTTSAAAKAAVLDLITEAAELARLPSDWRSQIAEESANDD